jgi:sulfur-oxidizing protein SoxY
MSDVRRRLLLKATLAGGAIGAAVGAGLLRPRVVFAAWPEQAFQAKSVSDALKGLYESDALVESADIKLKVPDIAENGAVVPVEVSTSLTDVKSIGIVIEKNGRPLAADFQPTARFAGKVSTRVKVAESSKLVAVVDSGGKLYSAAKEVKVTIGGCGG